MFLYITCRKTREHFVLEPLHFLQALCQDWFSRPETDVDGDAKVLGERVGGGSYYSRVVRAEAKRVRVEE